MITKLLYIHPSVAFFGGIERVLVDKLNYFCQKKNYEVYLITYDQGNHPTSFSIDGRVKHFDLGVRFHQRYAYSWPKRFFVYWQLQRMFNNRLREKIKEIAPNMIIANEQTPPSSILYNKGDIPYILESHMGYASIVHFRRSNLFKRILLKKRYNSFTKADAIVTLTEGDFKLWKSRNAKNIHLIPNFVNLNNTGVYSQQTNKSIIFAGRLTEEKGIEALVKIWEKTFQKHPDWYLDVYGEGELSFLLTSQSEGSNHIRLHRPVSDVFCVLCNSSILVCTSLYESFGLVLAEAMSCALPVVSFNCPFGPKDIIMDGRNGFLVHENKYDEYVEKLCLLIDNRDLRIKMGAYGTDSVQRFRKDDIMPMWEKLFAKMYIKRNA